MLDMILSFSSGTVGTNNPFALKSTDENISNFKDLIKTENSDFVSNVKTEKSGKSSVSKSKAKRKEESKLNIPFNFLKSPLINPEAEDDDLNNYDLDGFNTEIELSAGNTGNSEKLKQILKPLSVSVNIDKT